MDCWYAERGRGRAWTRRGVCDMLTGVSSVEAEEFFSPHRHQGGCMYAWGPASGQGELYIGSTMGGVYLGSRKGDRLFGHLAHVRLHKLGTCRCKRRVYLRAAAATDLRS